MNFINHATKLAASVQVNGYGHEIYATLAAHYDETNSELAIFRDAFARRPDARGPSAYAYPPWLPKCEVIRIGCAETEAVRLAEESYAHWLRLAGARIPEASPRAESLWPGVGADWASAGTPEFWPVESRA